MSKADLLARYKQKPTIEQLRVQSRVPKATLFNRAGISANTYYNIIDKRRPVREENVGKVLDVLTEVFRDRGILGPDESIDFTDVSGLWLSGEEPPEDGEK